MSNFCRYDIGSTHGGMLQRAVLCNREADLLLAQVRAIMVQMLDGDGSNDAHYATIQARFGFESVAVARAAFSELDSVFSKTGGDGTVSNVRAARDQFFARFTV